LKSVFIKATQPRGFFFIFSLLLPEPKSYTMNLRTWLIALLAVSSVVLRAQQQQPLQANLPVDPETKKIMYRAVVEEKGGIEYLYNKAVEWFSYYYRNPISVFTVQDKVNGRIEGIRRMNIYIQDE